MRTRLSILDCPFCGCRPKLWWNNHVSHSGIVWTVGCIGKKCPVKPEVTHDVQLIAIHQWNIRRVKKRRAKILSKPNSGDTL